jgi:hypothetical protein
VIPVVEDLRYVGWHRPVDWVIVSLAICRGCHEQIAWARTSAGRSAPLDRDGITHFATCSEAERFRTVRARQAPRVGP